MCWLDRCLRRRHTGKTRPQSEAVRRSRGRREEASPREAQLPRPQLLLMQGQLGSLLNKHARTRGALPHLALLERVLRRRGEAAMWTLPDAVLERSLQQLEALTDDWSQAGLSELRARLIAAVRPMRAEPAQDNLLSTFGTGDKLQVSEVGLSVFEEIEASNA